MGVALLAIGVLGFGAAFLVSKRAYAPAQRASSDAPPQPETGGVPRWIPAVYIGFLVVAGIGLLVMLF